ncbi:MAG: P1 family peptidase [Dehalococcoidales bacterium]|nr:P1 family peptidase [Dehalococcoidales bacterium]
MKTQIAGIRIGHYTDLDAATGCTVILCEEGAVGGVDVRGSAPGTRETDLLRPVNLVERVHAIVLSGGSVYGLNAVEGVMRYLEERGVGYETSAARVPVVPAAVLYDLDIGSARVRPGPEEGYLACLNAGNTATEEGCVGVGTGATVGKLLGTKQSTKSGLGMAGEEIGNNVIVNAIVAVNAVGDVIDPETGKILAGTLEPDGKTFANSVELLKKQGLGWHSQSPANTTIGAVFTNACLNKEQINKVAQMAQDGLARTIDPCHTMYDGDTLFALSLGREQCDVNIIGAVAAHLVSEAIIRAVMAARSLKGIPARSDIVKNKG